MHFQVTGAQGGVQRGRKEGGRHKSRSGGHTRGVRDEPSESESGADSCESRSESGADSCESQSSAELASCV